MSKKQMHIAGAVVVVAFILSAIFKQKTCQNAKSGDLKQRPWFWPCPTGSDSVASASTD